MRLTASVPFDPVLPCFHYKKPDTEEMAAAPDGCCTGFHHGSPNISGKYPPDTGTLSPAYWVSKYSDAHINSKHHPLKMKYRF